MKNSSILILAIIIFAVLGCNLSSYTEKDTEITIETPNPAAQKADTNNDDDGKNDTEFISESPSDESKSESGSSADLTKSKFDRLENDTSYDEAVKIIGSEGELTRETKTKNYTISSYKWSGKDNAAIYATFRDDKLTGKRQSRLGGELGKNGTADISKAKFDKIKIGMSYDEVVEIIGSKGTQKSSSTIGKTQLEFYQWSGEDYSAIYGNFRNGELSSKRQYKLK